MMNSADGTTIGTVADDERIWCEGGNYGRDFYGTHSYTQQTGRIANRTGEYLEEYSNENTFEARSAVDSRWINIGSL